MAISFLTNLSEEEFKIFLKQAITEVMEKSLTGSKVRLTDNLNIAEAAKYLNLKVSTLYEKTSQKSIPHIKKGNRLYFNEHDLKVWLEEGKVKTKLELEGDAATYFMCKKRKTQK